MTLVEFLFYEIVRVDHVIFQDRWPNFQGLYDYLVFSDLEQDVINNPKWCLAVCETGKILQLKKARGILFDLDNTLYPREKGVFPSINERISDFVRLSTRAENGAVETLRRDYREKYGTTLGGLMRHHAVDPDEYLEYVHDIPVERMLARDDSLASFLESIDLPMAILTNGSMRHARRVLDILGVSQYFDGVCDLAATNYLGKPHPEAFLAAAALLKVPLQETVFIDDLPVNVQAAGSFGSLTIHVNGKGDGVGDIQVQKVTDLVDIFSRLPWYRM